MNILVTEDDFLCRKLLIKLLEPYGSCDIAADGLEAVAAVEDAYKCNTPYDLICLDINMPILNGHETLIKIREIEKQHDILLGKGSKVMMVTGSSDSKSIVNAFKESCDGYLVKPFSEKSIQIELKKIGLNDKAA